MGEQTILDINALGKIQPLATIPRGVQMSTRNYDMFNPHRINRVDFEAEPRPDLVASMRAKGFQKEHPIKCQVSKDGELVVFAGHNRLNAAKHLGLEVDFIVYDSMMDPDEESSGVKAWTLADRVTARAKRGNEACREALWFAESHRVTIGCAFLLLSGQVPGVSCNIKLRDATAPFTNVSRHYAHTVMELIDMCEQHVDFARERLLIAAMGKVCLLLEFNPERMMEKIEKYPELLGKKRLAAQYVEMLNLIYNYHSKSSVKVDLVKLVKDEIYMRNHKRRRALNVTARG
jgi:hypothetical protein